MPPPPTDVLQHRPEEPAEVTVLRSKAQLLADSMRNFIAVQTFAWGSGDKSPAAVSAYEVRVLDGYQRFRKYPNGKKELQDVPLPPLNTVMASGGEWSELPQMVGTELRLKIHQAADVVVNERRMKVFQYRADPRMACVDGNPSSTLYSSRSTRLSPSLVTAKSGLTRIPTSSVCRSITNFPASGKTSRVW